jgi:pilus assembly protein Flp/PilA
MKATGKWRASLVRDEQAGEVLEYALVAALIVIAAVATISAVGGNVLARWNSLNGTV